MAVPGTKANIRQAMLARRRSLPPAEVAAASGEVCARLLELRERVLDAPFLMAYLEAGDRESATMVAEKIRAIAVTRREICDELARRTFNYGPGIQEGMAEALCTF